MTLTIAALVVVGIFVFAFIPDDSVARKLVYTILITYIGGVIVLSIISREFHVAYMMWPILVLAIMR